MANINPTLDLNETNVSTGSIRIVILGDGSVGKTCLMYAYVKNQFLHNYQPTTFDQNIVEVNINQHIYNIIITDIAGQHDYTNFREPAYSNADVFILTYSSISKDSFDNVKNYWIPEILDFEAKSAQLESTSSKNKTNNKNPIILVGTKVDLRENCQESTFIDFKTGEKLKNEIGAKCFIECSSLTQENVKAIFDSSVLAYFQNNPELAGRSGLGPSVISEKPEDLAAGWNKLTQTEKKKSKCTPCAACNVM